MQPDHRSPRLLPLFLVSATAIGFEVQLIRFFSIASWSEYGYWIISITMVGLSLSGVILSLFKDHFSKHAGPWLSCIPLALMAAASLGFYVVTLISFNPLEFQNSSLWFGQLMNVGKYYLALFPFFFLSGLYIGICFISSPQQVPKVYAADLTGAAFGSLFLMLAMNFVHPFYLLTVLLPLLFLAGAYSPSRLGVPLKWASLILAFGLSEAGALFLNQADYCEFKPIYAALNVEGSRSVEREFSPRGLYLVLDNFTEKLDIDLSNNYSLLGVEGPPDAFGLYQDGNRLSALPKTKTIDTRYAKASLDHLPYELRPGGKALLIGTRGGFKVPEVLSAGTAQVTALEPDPVLYSLISDPGRYGGDWLSSPKVQLLREPPLAYLSEKERSFDVIDLSSEFLDQGSANRSAFTEEALQAYYRVLAPNGVLSIPVPIKELTVYALKALNTALNALKGSKLADPERHLLLYRSAWNARVLVFKTPLQAQDLKKIRAFCSDRSFDISYYAGIRPGGQEIWNEIPPSPLGTTGAPARSKEPQDALVQESTDLLSNNAVFIRDHFFDLRPSTLDRPFFYSVLKFSNLGTLLHHLPLIPREEIGYLVNWAVLFQSVLFATVILALPFLGRRRRALDLSATCRLTVYFAGLGMGFLLIEIALIEKASAFLGDRTLAFSLVLCGMLFFSGMGSWSSSRYAQEPRRGLRTALALVLPWLALAFFFLDPLLSSVLGLALAAKIAVLLVLLAPLSFGLGMPFAIGLGSLEGETRNFIPWAWALNGAFSVVATPLANLIAVSWGYSRLFGSGLLIYLLIGLVFFTLHPKGKNETL